MNLCPFCGVDLDNCLFVDSKDHVKMCDLKNDKQKMIEQYLELNL